MSFKILHLDTSGRTKGSHSRPLSAQLVSRLRAKHEDTTVTYRDLSKGVPFVDQETLLCFNNVPRAASRTRTSMLSDSMVKELIEANALVVGLPIYNFSVPACMKAYFDLIARVGVTFKYTESGVKGLIPNKKVYLVVTSGGTSIGSEADFCVNYVKFFLAFLGITDVEVIEADQLMLPAGEQKIAKAKEQIEAI